MIFFPFGAPRATGLDPLAAFGQRFSSRSVACWLPVPSRVRLLEVLRPALDEKTKSPAAIRIQTTMTQSRWRDENEPSR